MHANHWQAIANLTLQGADCVVKLKNFAKIGHLTAKECSILTLEHCEIDKLEVFTGARVFAFKKCEIISNFTQHENTASGSSGAGNQIAELCARWRAARGLTN
jgi:hypothetical protein